jgi:hypothetical protein
MFRQTAANDEITNNNEELDVQKNAMFYAQLDQKSEMCKGIVENTEFWYTLLGSESKHQK